MVTKGKREWGRDKLGVWNQQIQNTIRKIDNKVRLYSTGNYIQYPVINHNGKECEKICVYMCVHIYYLSIQLNHFAVYQKLTQCCKSNTLQFKKKFFKGWEGQKVHSSHQTIVILKLGQAHTIISSNSEIRECALIKAQFHVLGVSDSLGPWLCPLSHSSFSIRNGPGTSLVVQWLRIRLPMQQTRV